MITRALPPSPDSDRAALLERLRDATELLESIAADRGLLSPLPAEELKRLLQAVGLVYHPDAVARRRLVKATVSRRRADKAKRDDRVLAQTGIRTLRRQTVFTTPSVFAPRRFEPRDIGPDAEDGAEPRGSDAQREAIDPRCCYVCKREYSTVHHFYDRLCPACGELNFTKRTELANLQGRVALLTGGRVKIGYPAGPKLLPARGQPLG